MKDRLDYTMEVVELRNVLQTVAKHTNDQLIIHSRVFMAKETAQLFELTDGSRIKKTSLGTVKSLNTFYPDFKAYCLPEQVEETKLKLIEAVDKHINKMLELFGRLKSQVENSPIIMTEHEYRRHTIEMASSPKP
jgi:hypothetical protein